MADKKFANRKLSDQELDGVAGGMLVYDQNGELAAAFKENTYLSFLRENCRLPKDLRSRLYLLGIDALGVDADLSGSEKDMMYTIENDNNNLYTYKEVCHYIRYLSPEIIDETLSKRGR